LVLFLTTPGIYDIILQEFKGSDTKVVAKNTQLKPVGFTSGIQINPLSHTLSLPNPQGTLYYGDDLLRTGK